MTGLISHTIGCPCQSVRPHTSREYSSSDCPKTYALQNWQCQPCYSHVDANMLSADCLMYCCSWLNGTHDPPKTHPRSVPACVLSVNQALFLGFVDVVGNGPPVALASTALLRPLVQGVTGACQQETGSHRALSTGKLLAPELVAVSACNTPAQDVERHQSSPQKKTRKEGGQFKAQLLLFRNF